MADRRRCSSRGTNWIASSGEFDHSAESDAATKYAGRGRTTRFLAFFANRGVHLIFHVIPLPNFTPIGSSRQ
jgi:hypothetical protein